MVELEDDLKVSGNSKKGWRLIYKGITLHRTISKTKADNWKHWLTWYKENIKLLVMEDLKKLERNPNAKIFIKSGKKNSSGGWMDVVPAKGRGKKGWRLTADGSTLRETDSETEADNWKNWVTWYEEILSCGIKKLYG